MTWVCRFLDSDVASTSRHAATAKADQASNGPSHPANHVCHPSQRPLPCHHHHSHFQHNHWPYFTIKIDNALLQTRQQCNPSSPPNRQPRKSHCLPWHQCWRCSTWNLFWQPTQPGNVFLYFFSPQMSTPAASWSSCLPMWFQGLLRTSVFFAPVRRRSRAFTTEALSFTEWSTGWCFFSKSWT